MVNITISYSIDSPTNAKSLSLIFTIIQLTYGIPSFLLMLFFLVKLRRYSNSFYRIVQLDLLTNILCYTNTWLSIRLYVYTPGIYFLFSLENLFPGILSFTGVLVNFFFHMQFCSAISLSIHRVTSVIFHSRYDKFWSKWYIVYSLLCALYSYLPELAVPGRTSTFKVVNRTIIQEYNNERVSIVSFQTAIFSISYFLLLLIFGLFTAFLVSKTLQGFNVSDRGIGKKLTKIALTYCFLFSGILLWTIVTATPKIRSILPDAYVKYSFDAMIFSSDLMTLALPYVLLVFDSNIRRDFFERSSIGATPIFVFSSSGVLN